MLVQKCLEETGDKLFWINFTTPYNI